MKANPLLKEIMTPNPITLNIDEPFLRVAEIFQERSIRHLPIVNKQGVIMGIISQRDLNRVAIPKHTESGEYVYNMEELASYVLRQHVIQKVLTMKPDDTVEKALEVMIPKKFGCIPVVDDGDRVLGIVTAIDLQKLQLKILREG